ncbi:MULTISPECIES: zinc ribbon domain-containing protein [Photorhabdus]|uniref:Zinc ribbon domain-containing protein n=1 Tax=Photorhabdus bodei TaxID=2029681 RepID=A0AAW6BJI6_9GAMM|nr:zinc ribbon domain-containing protein [Photorhabdus bodei]MCC8466966.1 zinc ribbon domain-containing protein [Photorhabdus bodei]MDB6373592.1 zinc ribbon domain-containing protein [Photorhabdus bodei]
MQEDLNLSLFDEVEYEERADYIDKQNLLKWTATSKHHNNIQKKLIQVGAKLIVGPRGTGKTHQMRCAYFDCKNDTQKPLPFYVTFNHYLRLETYLHESSNAIDIFHAWVLAKIVFSCEEDYGIFLENVNFTSEDLKKFIIDIEKQKYNQEHARIISDLSLNDVKNLIEKTTLKNNRKRAVLFLDDAALTFTNNYMIEFFDIFRSLKTIKISPKASVYPGTTQYGPRFHVGQDAERVPIWMSVEDSDYLQFMDALGSTRFGNNLDIDQDMRELLMYAAFGIPRTYIMFLRSYTDSDRKKPQSKFNSIISEKCTNIINEYRSIAQKMPQYSNIINIGDELMSIIVETITEFNHKRIDEPGNNYKKNIVLGVEDIDNKAERMIKFLIEAGILYAEDDISHGSDRKIRRFIPHLALLIKKRALTKSRGFNISDLLRTLKGPSEKHPVRKKFTRLLSQDKIDSITLDLPPCSNCQTPRIIDGQRFCHICGAALLDSSIFKNCMSTKLLDLPLTEFQKKVISKTKYITIEDVLTSDNTAAELKKVKGVGDKYSEKIITKINEWTNEFLY